MLLYTWRASSLHVYNISKLSTYLLLASLAAYTSTKQAAWRRDETRSPRQHRALRYRLTCLLCCPGTHREEEEKRRKKKKEKRENVNVR